MRASDLDRYNELTIHHEIAAKKVHTTQLLAPTALGEWIPCLDPSVAPACIM